MKWNNTWFTLVELIVSISILSIIMVSVFTVFALSADLNNKTDISRSLQENIKNIVETIAEDLRRQGTSWVNSDIISSKCELKKSEYLSGSKLCIWNNTYYLAKQVEWEWNRIVNNNECSENIQCFLVQNNGHSITQLSNSWVEFKNLTFYVSDSGMKKVTLQFEMQPSRKKGIKPDLVKDSKIIFQTTLSERLYNDY